MSTDSDLFPGILFALIGAGLLTAWMLGGPKDPPPVPVEEGRILRRFHVRHLENFVVIELGAHQYLKGSYHWGVHYPDCPCMQ